MPEHLLIYLVAASTLVACIALYIVIRRFFLAFTTDIDHIGLHDPAGLSKQFIGQVQEDALAVRTVAEDQDAVFCLVKAQCIVVGTVIVAFLEKRVPER